MGAGFGSTPMGYLSPEQPSGRVRRHLHGRYVRCAGTIRVRAVLHFPLGSMEQTLAAGDSAACRWIPVDGPPWMGSSRGPSGSRR